MSGYIYLIGYKEPTSNYKIGCTKRSSVEQRINELQTGNHDKLVVYNTFKTDNPYKLELMLHNHFNNKHTYNEWYELDESDIENFTSICEKYQKNIDALKNNPFFK